MRRRISPCLPAIFSALLGFAPLHPALAAEPHDPAGNVGATDYGRLPFAQTVFRACWGCSAQLEPGQLFFDANPASFFNDPKLTKQAKDAAAEMEQQGIVPSGGAQRWQDTYAAAFPAGTFKSEPSWVQRDRDLGLPAKPEFVAWRDFITQHPQYWDIAFDGGPMPSNADDFRGWGAQWGHISPLTPLDRADCPPEMARCTWGDAYAWRWGRVAQRTGGYGLIMSDFNDSQPHWPSTIHDFNPRIIAAFEGYAHVSVPPGPVPERAAWIVANAFAPWNDFLSDGYGRFFAALAKRLGAATGRAALIEEICSLTPSYRRLVGNDERILAQQISPRNIICLWDNHLIQGDRPGPVAAPPMRELAGFVIGAAREPLLRNGADLEADEPAFWKAIARAYPTLDEAARREAGSRILKRLWLWSAWAHIADRDGHVRRALAFMSRNYWDQGSLTLLDPLTKLIQTIVPTRPFGPALYYSVAVERAIEAREGPAAGPGHSVVTYLPQAELQALLDAHGLGYYVSDAALGQIHKGDAAAPSAWIVPGDGAVALLPPAERQALDAVAPIVGSAADLPDEPLATPAGMTGFGFYDQHDRLILVLSNPGTAPDALPVSGTVRLSGLVPASYQVTELFTGTASPLTVDRTGSATLQVALARWDTQAFALIRETAHPHR